MDESLKDFLFDQFNSKNIQVKNFPNFVAITALHKALG